MKHIDFEFDGHTYALSFTAEALFTVYDKFGYTADILGTTKVMEPTVEGWKNLCWLAALMASQGELQRRNRGEDPKPMVTMEGKPMVYSFAAMEPRKRIKRNAI